MEDNYMKRMPLTRHISLETDRCREEGDNEGGTYVEEPEDEGLGQEIDSCPICFDALMDPCSLNCGHTFCELCLAKVWKTEAGNWSDIPRSILCPTCRNPTESFPQVNFAMRNMIEANPVNKKKIAERRSQLAPEDVQLLDKVKDSRKMNREQAEANRTEDLEQHGRRLNLRFNVDLGGQRNNSTCLAILFCAGVFAFILGVLLYGVTFLSGEASHGAFIATWSSDEVADWVATEFPPWGVELAMNMKQEKVDGERLLVLNGDNLRDLGVENQFRQQTVLHYINHLKAGTAPRQPRSLTEFNEYYFRDTLIVINLFKMGHPNVAIWILYFTNYDHGFLPFYRAATSVGIPLIGSLWQGEEGSLEEVEQREDFVEESIESMDGMIPVDRSKADPSRPLSWGQLLLFWMMMFVVSPHVLVGKVALSWISESPFIASVIVINCVCRFFFQHLVVLRTQWQHRGILSYTFFLNYYLITPAVQTVTFYAIFSITWRILPTFLWTLTYYILLFDFLWALCGQIRRRDPR